MGKTLIAGLTGGIGSGKTTVAKMFEEEGIPIYIADDRAKIIMDRKDIVDRVQDIFPINVITDDYKLDRKVIRETVFENKELLEKLNDIVHPEVKKDFEQWVASHLDKPFVIKETAILFEKKLDKQCDLVILVTAPDELRIERIKKRDNVSNDNIRQIMNNQLSDEYKKQFSNYVIENIDIKKVKHEVKCIINNIKEIKSSF
ncbi:dephospho-CoA kinase [Myroides injenensis]|uniref:dephospho-CoA kinase n=1 Tax=Myroides injenensis TaxID=1183151 RepID=UPI0002F5E8E1|nr:dephospho-CoA kinase [Myroides injenensis]